MNNNNCIIQMLNVSKKFKNNFALKNINLNVKKGEFIFLSGPAGSGKSILLKVLYLAEKITNGKILIDGIDLAKVSSKKLALLRRRFGMIFNDFKLIPNLTVYENVALVLQASGEKETDIKEKVMSVLQTTNMEKKYKDLPPSLSGGEQQRTAVARALVAKPSIILADEPTASLDYKSGQEILDLLVQYHKNDATILIASHNLHLLKSTVQGRNIQIDKGQIKSNIVML